MWWYYIVRFIMRGVMWVIFGYKVIGKENIPQGSGFVVCSNHKSNWDVIVSGASYNNPVTFMAKKELFRNRIAGYFLTKLNAFPISRGAGDLSAIKNSIKVLKEGHVLNIYPEGTRVRDGKKHDYKRGAAMIASAAGVPILPCAICGKYKWRGNVQFKVGKPIYLDKYTGRRLSDEELDEIMKNVMNEINLLKTEGGNS